MWYFIVYITSWNIFYVTYEKRKYLHYRKLLHKSVIYLTTISLLFQRVISSLKILNTFSNRNCLLNHPQSRLFSLVSYFPTALFFQLLLTSKYSMVTKTFIHLSIYQTLNLSSQYTETYFDNSSWFLVSYRYCGTIRIN